MKTPKRRIGTIWHIAFEKKATMVVKDVAPIALTPCRRVHDMRATVKACGSEGLEIIPVNVDILKKYAIERGGGKETKKKNKRKKIT